MSEERKNIIKQSIMSNELGSGDAATKDVFFRYLNLLKKNIGIVIAIFITTLLTTVFYINSADNVYQSTLLLKLEANQKQDFLGGTMLGSELSSFTDNRAIRNQTKLLQSYEIRDRVAAAILAQLPQQDLGELDFLVFTDPETKEKSMLEKHAIRKRLRSVNISQFEADVDIISIELEGLNFDEISFVTKVYANEYIQYSLEKNVEDIEKVKSFLEGEKHRRLNDLNEIEGKLTSFRKEYGVQEISDQQKMFIEKSLEYEEQKYLVYTELNQIGEKIRIIDEKILEIDSTLYQWVNNAINKAAINELQERITQLELQKEFELLVADDTEKVDIASDYDQKIGIVRQQINGYFDKFRQNMSGVSPELRNEYKDKKIETTLDSLRLVEKEKYLTKVLARIDSELSVLPDIAQKYYQLTRELTTNERLYLLIEEKYQESEILQRSRITSAYILDPGTDSAGPVKPKRGQILIMGLVLGVGLGLAYLFIIDTFRRFIINPDEIENFGFPVLSWIPKMEEEKGKITRIYVNERPTSTISESFKALRTRLMYAKLDDNPLQTILVTSTIPSEGKTTLTVNTAAAFAQLDKKVLLIDCDLRKPRMHNFFKVDKKPGLSDYLFKKASIEDIIVEKDGIHFIPSGTIPPNPSELLNSHHIKDFLDEMRKRFDYIFIDSPPFITVTDSDILSKITDGTIMVSRANFTPIELFKDSIKKFYTNNPDKLLGVALNDFSYRDNYGSYYKYYYYYYSEDTNKDGTRKKK